MQKAQFDFRGFAQSFFPVSVCSILAVNATGKFLDHFGPLVFVNGQPYAEWVTKGVARAIRNIEWTAFWRPASITQRSDGAFKPLDAVYQNGYVALKVIG